MHCIKGEEPASELINLILEGATFPNPEIDSKTSEMLLKKSVQELFMQSDSTRFQVTEIPKEAPFGSLMKTLVARISANHELPEQLSYPENFDCFPLVEVCSDLIKMRDELANKGYSMML